MQRRFWISWNLSALGMCWPCAGTAAVPPESPDFKHASDLTSFIKWKKPAFSVHGACYPEGHPEADSLLHDVENLRIKQAAGAEHLLTQLFFDNMHFTAF